MKPVEFFKEIYQLCENGNIDFRYIEEVPKGKKPKVEDEFLPLSKIDNLPDFPKGQHIYFAVSTRKGGGTREHIVQIPAVWVDIDFKDTSRNEAIKTLSACPSPPSITVHSGGGYHAYWLLKEPLGYADVEAVESVNRRLIEYHGGDKGTWDAARVLRVPGTFNVKKGYKKDGVYPQVDVVESTGQRYELSDFDNWLPEDHKKPLPADVVVKDGTKELEELNLPKSLKDKITQGVDKGDRSTVMFSVIHSHVRAGAKDKAILTAFESNPNGIGEKYFEKGAGRFKWLADQIRKARAQQASEIKPKDDYIKEMNRKHAVVMLSGECVVMNFFKNPITHLDDINFSNESNFRKSYHTDIIPITKEDGKIKYVGIAKLWLDSKQRATYNGIVFDPQSVNSATRSVSNGYYNLWNGLAVVPKKGKWNLFEDHINKIICNDNLEYTEWVLSWMARLVQDPGGDRPGTSVVLRGNQGTGKGVFAQTFGKIFGQHFLHVSSQQHVTGRFNSHLKNNLLLFADEAFFAGDKRDAGTLKALITEPEHVIEEKYRNPIPVKNHVNLIIASNSSWVVPAGLHERRFCVLDVSSARIGDREYFKTIIKQMENGGLAAMLHDLLNRKIDVDLRCVPKTEALIDQQLNGMDTVPAWLLNCLVNGEIEEDHMWPIRISRQGVYDSFLLFCEKQRERRPLNSVHFGRQFRKYMVCGESRIEGKRQYELPDLNEARSDFIEKSGIKYTFEGS